MSARVDIPLAELTRLIQEYRGNVSAIARAKRCSRHTVQARIDESVLAGRALEDARESFVDEVEAALYANALDGNVAAQIFVMKAHPAAKRRGWSERTEHTGAEGGEVVVKIEYVNDWRGEPDRS